MASALSRSSARADRELDMPNDRVNLPRGGKKTTAAPPKDKTQKSSKRPFDPSKFPDWKVETANPPGTSYIIVGARPSRKS